MAGTNDFKAIATGGGANVITQEAYSALTSFLANGFSSGVVESDQFNKVIRQSSFIAAVLGQLIADTGINAVDDGDVPGFVADLISSFRSFSPPPGTVIHVAMNTAPAGFLKANGAAISRTTYASLFSAIGTTFGSGNGSTTFNVPDLRGEFLRGWDDSRGVDSSRSFGSAQKGTIHSIDSTGTDVLYVTAMTSTGLAANSALVAQRTGLDYDENGATNYPDTASVYVAGGGTGGFAYGVSRPRNIALLACIKY